MPHSVFKLKVAPEFAPPIETNPSGGTIVPAGNRKPPCAATDVPAMLFARM